MPTTKNYSFFTLVFLSILTLAASAEEWTSGIQWEKPAVVNPGPVGGPPADAIILFDGKSVFGNGKVLIGLL